MQIMTNLTIVNASIEYQQQQQSSVLSYTIAIALVMYILIFVVGLIGNAIVIFVVSFNKSLQHNTNYCLVNLSVADLLLIIVCLPTAIVDLFAKEVWYFGNLMCKIIPWLEYSIAHASVLTIMAISVERSFAISSPLTAKRYFTSTRLCLVVVVIWIISTISTMPIMTSTTILQFRHKTLGKMVEVCVTSTKPRWYLIYLYSSLFFFYLLPCILLFIQLSRIVLTIKRRNQLKRTNTETALNEQQQHQFILTSTSAHSDLNNNHNNNSSSGGDGGDVNKKLKTKSLTSFNSSSKYQTNCSVNDFKMPHINQKQIIRLLIVMVLLCFICLLPYRIFSLWSATATIEDYQKLGIIKHFNLTVFVRVTFYLNSALNPIFYHMISSKFQSAFKKFFHNTNNSRRPSPNGTASVLHIKQRGGDNKVKNKKLPNYKCEDYDLNKSDDDDRTSKQESINLQHEIMLL